jgi:hypothetical protein
MVARKTWLDGDNIACHQGPRIHLFRDAVRVLMNQQLMPHAMTRSVIEVDPQLPQRPAGKGINLMTLRARGELQSDNRQKAFQHRGVVQTALRIQRAVRQRACRVGGAVVILTA